MEKQTTDAKRDILTEDYKGTGAVISGLGYWVIETKVFGVLGLIGGALVGALAPKQVNAWSETSQRISKNLVEKNPVGSGALGTTKRWFGHSANKIFEWSDKIAEHLPFKSYFQKRAGGATSGRGKAMIAASGIAGIAGFLISTVHGFFVGAKSASDGKDQFDYAKSEIRTLRDDKEALTNELEKTSKELAKTKAEVTKFAAENDVTPKTIISNAEHAETITHKSHHQHHGHHV